MHSAAHLSRDWYRMRSLCTFVEVERGRLIRCVKCSETHVTHTAPENVNRECPVDGIGDYVSRMLSLFGIRKRGTCGCGSRQAMLNRIWAAAQNIFGKPATEPAIANDRHGSLLLRWPHGLGDAVQGTIVLRHLRELHPEWKIDCAAKLGQRSVFEGLADRTFNLGDEPGGEHYESAITLDWWDPEATYSDSPSTKAERCLREVFRIQPIERLCRPQIDPSAAIHARVAAHCPSSPFALVHYQGNSASENKTLNEHAVREVVLAIAARGITPVILDWERPTRSGLVGVGNSTNFPNGHPIWGDEGAPSGSHIAALAQRSIFNFGIDSGPGHIMTTTDVPMLMVWLNHHPIHYSYPIESVLHVVPENHAAAIWGDVGQGLEYFHRRYRHYVTSRDYRLELAEAVSAALDGDNWDQRWLHKPRPEFIQEAGHWIRSKHRENDLGIIAEVHCHDDYRVADFPDDTRRVIDVGAHIGAFATKVRERFADAELVCVEANPRNIECLSKNAPFATIVPAAATYDRDVVLLNSMFEGASAGPSDSEVVPAGDPRSRLSGDANRHQVEPVATTTIEAIMEQLGWQSVDVLKLDCEGGEWSILEHLPEATKKNIRLIVGEYHRGADRLRELAARRFPNWELRILSSKLPTWDDGGFWLVNRADFCISA